ncbi:uncharacterized protein LOC120280983 isoform X2 [Dioscorea cayenensis subsp. rotundata]|uniref:Uncharacterized protein LOC120280983 isoform X2 n=1 Tax=Dioscorea cayennensis subsp. rotundata TaxID=55577 RepID=A0AB40CV91_DIOCR|nr:uncharacterized protein LOC120280983 isoform X2 [Dioscorea cayenensis subsp. rotundata]
MSLLFTHCKRRVGRRKRSRRRRRRRRSSKSSKMASALLSTAVRFMSRSPKTFAFKMITSKSLCTLCLSTKQMTRSKSVHNPRSCAAIASMVGGKAKKSQIVIPDPDYRIPIVLLGLAGIFVYQENLLVAAPVGLLGLLLLFQTTRVRFVFDEEALEVKLGDQLQESGENVFVGGKNRWKYSTFVNWELWWPNFPILVYFKETQTKPEGQVHFFPVIFNGKQLYDVMVERASSSKTSLPK